MPTSAMFGPSVRLVVTVLLPSLVVAAIAWTLARAALPLGLAVLVHDIRVGLPSAARAVLLLPPLSLWILCRLSGARAPRATILLCPVLVALAAVPVWRLVERLDRMEPRCQTLELVLAPVEGVGCGFRGGPWDCE